MHHRGLSAVLAVPPERTGAVVVAVLALALLLASHAVLLALRVLRRGGPLGRPGRRHEDG